MIGIDTNILVRYLTQDDSEQAKIVEKTLNKYATSSQSIFINNIVICELIWVLERGYKYNKESIIEVVKLILSTKEFCFENQKLLRNALSQYSQKKLDFSDALIGEINKNSGCISTLTFDKAAMMADNFIMAK
ncbi:MAG: type II toxin-antitoxin system VapC family toxin [Rickettsiales bacterium]|jgi:predicted nucleic-acid-binding protein|nr:type II toxin-antitoxin system VapC family toxin [Rickettsiales bacterium]